MQPILSRRQLSAALIAAISIAFTLPAVASDVLSVKLSGSGVIQDEVNGAPAMQPVKLTNAGLINIARGRNANQAVPANEVLAGVLSCSTALELIVFDTSTSSRLVSIAVPVESDTAGDAKKGVGVIMTQISATPLGANSLDGGYLLFAGSASLASGCPVKFSSTVTGIIDVTITDDVGKHSETILVPKGKLTLGSKIGTLAP
jgi:hypothetical protein